MYCSNLSENLKGTKPKCYPLSTNLPINLSVIIPVQKKEKKKCISNPPTIFIFNERFEDLVSGNVQLLLFLQPRSEIPDP